MAKSLRETAAEIVQAQAAMKQMTAEEISKLLTSTFTTLVELDRIEKGEPAQGTPTKATEQPSAESKPTLTAAEAFQADKITCLECGKSFAMLTWRHLKTHDMDARAYKKKHGIKLGTPLMATDAAEKRRTAAKKRGLPGKLVEYQANRIRGRAKKK